MNELHRLTATEAVHGIRAGKIKAEDLVASCLNRISEREPLVGAWAFIDAEGALTHARELDRATTEDRLCGVPIAVKDMIDTGDMPTQYNSAIYRNYQPFADAACVALARRSGGVVLGKTVTTEFASRSPGPTRNPHHLQHTPGGSSSGSAAAVADFMVPLAFGTQTGGSVIRPAAYCGVVGYKPSFGTINSAGMKHLAESMDTIGVMGRSVPDCALLVNATSGRNLPDFANAVLPAPRIGLCRTSRWHEASNTTHALLEQCALVLSKKGAIVRDVDLPADFDRLYDEQPLISGVEASNALAPELHKHAELLSSHMRKHLEMYGAVPRVQYSEAIHHASSCRLRFAQYLTETGVDMLLTPSAPDEAPAGIERTGSSLFNRNWTLLGLPCITLPVGRGPHQLPLGIQLIVDYDDDERLLFYAEWVRNALL